METETLQRFVGNAQDAQRAVNTIIGAAAITSRFRDEFIRAMVRAAMPMDEMVAIVTKAYCFEALRTNGWNYSRAARAIGMHRNSLARHVGPQEIAKRRRDHRKAISAQRAAQRRKPAFVGAS